MTPSGPTVGPAATSQRLASGPTPVRCGQEPTWKLHSGFCAGPFVFWWLSLVLLYVVPSCTTAGEQKMMSVVANDQRIMPARPAAETCPSCDANSTVPSSSNAGDDVMGPPVRYVQA